MEDPAQWFKEAIDSGKYKKDIIVKMSSCISENRFDITNFMSWVSEQLEEDLDED